MNPKIHTGDRRTIRHGTMESARASTAASGSGDETGPLERLLGPPARTRIVEAFVAERGRDLTVSDVARLADVARSTVYRHIEDLETLGVVEHARDGRDGHSPRYQLNDDSEVATLLYRLEGATLRRLLEVEGHLAE